MRLILSAFSIAILVIPTVTQSSISKGVIKTTAERIASHNYHVESHSVQTSDGYILTMFRIPYSPKLKNKSKPRPVVLLQHGLLSSSDCWILNGPNDGLAYLFVDAGYDVWMGNARGNTYSKKHVKMSSLLPSFWDFSWNEIAIKDMPAMIDYVLSHTKQKALHYVGHSQGTTVFFVLMSSIPSYNAKITTAHMIAPVAFMKNAENPIAEILAPFIGYPSLLVDKLGKNELLPNNKLISLLGSRACGLSSPLFKLCSNFLIIMGGPNSEHLNYTLLPEVIETHPAGSSTRQLIHYLQLYKSGYFRKYDYGKVKNRAIYGQEIPPDYEVKNIVAPVRFYYSDNDVFAAVDDVKKMQQLLPNLVESFHVPFPKWNHLDFLWALEVKEVIYDRIIGAAQRYDKTGKL